MGLNPEHLFKIFSTLPGCAFSLLSKQSKIYYFWTIFDQTCHSFGKKTETSKTDHVWCTSSVKLIVCRSVITLMSRQNFCKQKQNKLWMQAFLSFLTFPASFYVYPNLFFPIWILIVLIYQIWETTRAGTSQKSILLK